MINSLFQNSDYLSKALDASWLRNNVISNNISNVDTPNFKASTVDFESVLKDAMDNNSISMKVTNDKHIASNNTLDTIQPTVTEDTSSQIRMDGNNVDIEAQESDLAENAIYYNTLIKKISDEYSRIKYAINEGK
jgi:flagellar basal-body rod protein FlgB